MQRAAQVGQSCCISAAAGGWQLDSPGLLTREEEVLPAELKDKTAETVAGFSLFLSLRLCARWIKYASLL